MNQFNQVTHLLREWEFMSQKNTFRFIEKTVFLQMIDHLTKEGHWQRATAVVNQAIVQHPFSTDLYLRKAELLLNRNMIAECLVTIEQAETFAPSNVDIKLFRAELMMAQGSFLEALEILDDTKLSATSDELSDIYMTEALIYEDLRNPLAMLKSLRRCLWTNPKNTEGYEKMLLLVQRQAYFEESVEFHNKLLDKDAYNWFAWLNLGYALRGLDRINEAIEAFEFAYAIEPQCRLAYFETADMFIEKGEIMRALLTYENAIFNTQEDSELLIELGNCHDLLGNHPVAVGFYKRALEFDKNNPDIYYKMGESYSQLNDWDNAIPAYTTAIKLDNQNEFNHLGLANAYFQKDNLSKAFFSYRKAVQIGGDDVSNWMRYVYFLMNIGQLKKAQKALDEAEMQTGGPEVEYGRIALLYLLGKKEEAVYKLAELKVSDEGLELLPSHFPWRPEIAENPNLIKVIKAFLP